MTDKNHNTGDPNRKTQKRIAVVFTESKLEADMTVR